MTTIPNSTPIPSANDIAQCTTARECARRLVARQLEKIDANFAALGAEDVDAVHDVRVASRRLRATLREFAPIAKKKTHRGLKKSAKKITAGLGETRELDVCLLLLAHLRRDGEDGEGWASLHDHLADRRRRTSEAVHAVAKLVGSSRFRSKAMKTNRGFRAGDSCFLSDAPERVGRAAAQLGEAQEEWESARTDESLHAVRIRLKKLRYICEIYAPTLPGELDRELKTMKRAQGLLGDWNDARVLLDRARRFGISEDVLQAIDAEVSRRMTAIRSDLDILSILAQLRNLPAQDTAACCRSTHADSGNGTTEARTADDG